MAQAEKDATATMAMLESKRELIFKRINRLYDHSKKINTYESRGNENFLIDSETIDTLRDKFEAIVDRMNEINLAQEPESTPDYACLDAFEDLYIRVKHVRNKLINRSKVVSSRSDSGDRKNVSQHIKLPPIELPTFDGKMENWPKFYEAFKANIHNNQQLSDSQRVQYLVGRLTHNALKVTAGVVPTGETYKIIWDSLVNKYQDKRALGIHYLNNILDLKNCLHNANSLDSFVETYSASMAALKQLGIDDLTDFIFLHCALRKVDTQTAQSFELSVRDINIPSSATLISFMQDQVKIMERSNPTNFSSGSKKPPARSSYDRSTHTSKSFLAENVPVPSEVGTSATAPQCELCNESGHTHLYKCMKFKNLPNAKARFEYTKSKHACVSCLSVSHTLTNCKSSSLCGRCQKRHHTLLHFDKVGVTVNVNPSHAHVSSVTQLVTEDNTKFTECNQIYNRPSRSIDPTSWRSTATTAAHPSLAPSANFIDASAANASCTHPPSIAQPPPHNPTVLLSAESKPLSMILLSTAQVYARPKGGSGQKAVVRCLIDNGSQNNLVTTDCCRALNLPIVPLSNSFVKGIGSTSRPILGYVYIDIESRVYPDQKYSIHALVVESITEQLPSQFIEWNSSVDPYHSLPLADLSWNIPGDINVVLGAQLFPYIYLGNKVESGTRFPPALLTTFGYVLMGDLPHKSDIASVTASFSALAINDLVQRFWELEEVSHVRLLSPEETECENLYTSSVVRDDSGRYSVSLPFCKDPAELGNSHAAAHRRFMALEKKFRQMPDLRLNYNKVIQDYIDNGYLSPVAESEMTDTGYYIPHHAVTRSDKPLPRIVLDASAKTHSGLSLNDVLHIGPNLQADLFLLLLNFRLFPVAMMADIKQMYLRIGVAVDHRKYLRILFRFSQDEQVHTFQFKSLPFGLKASPFIAMRTVRQLAADMSLQYPDAAKIAETSLYMDDLVYSAPDEDTAKKSSQDLIMMFKYGTFDLVKWSSNSPVLLESLPDSHRKSLEFDAKSCVSKVLGLSWEPCEDAFFFTSNPITENCTKRNILSIVARLFDVLGLVAPVILYAKLLIKELWLSNSGWDDLAPENIVQRFSALVQEFPILNSLKIPRHVGISSNCAVNLIAFCDASLNGYGCVVYVHCTHPTGVDIKLLCAKSKVSPTKITTLARLELCAALLMSKLIKVVRDTYAARIPIAGIYAFSDSTIALSWIHSSPHRWSIFVSNRVAQCQENLDPKHFFHVAGVENPSDCLSRGMLPAQLVSHDLWWNGPPWMRCAPDKWPIEPFSPSSSGELPEHKANVMTVTSRSEPPVLCELAQRTSSWEKLLRTIVYVLKFARPQVELIPGSIHGLLVAERAMIRAVQSVYFAEDIKLINSKKFPSKKLLSLAVFLDEEGILRVGGRLAKSDLPFDAKYPALLPKHDHVVDLIIRHYHVQNCHTGPGLLMSILRQRFWILDARTVVRCIVRKCNTCFRVNPTHPTPRMADLPAYRISEAKAFVHTGVDYAGPIRITLTRRRGQHAQKAYICLFVCLVTKAVHIELVTELTSDAFLAAFKRFISRRGPVSCLYSDNGTNFIGAKAQLDELYSFLLKSSLQSSLSNELSARRIEWKMIPPRSPHFGSMWETNIKCLKTHLYRVVGDQLLTYEELQTVLVQIECIMNSHPLNVVSADPHPEVLTPAHFLMSSPLKYLPAADFSDQRINLTQRKRLLDSMVQSFWKKWRLEYLHTLQVRQKWATPDKPVEVGTVVLFGQDDTPTLSWPLGVITEVFKGSDGVARVAIVKTNSGSYKRAVMKLYPIPTQ